jgi:exodeoxyribonuclease VII large subunit
LVNDSFDRLLAAVHGYLDVARDAISSEHAHVARFSPKSRLYDARAELGRLRAGLDVVETAHLPVLRTRLESAHHALCVGGQSPLTDRRSQLSRLQAVIAALEPATVLRRGYAILEHPATGAVVSSVNQVARGVPVNARLHDGVLTTVVDHIDAVPGVGHNARV